jgi:hypothetical protein
VTVQKKRNIVIFDLLLFLSMFGAVMALEKFVHRRLQEVFLLLTGHMDSATFLYSLVLLPGVFLHELSHAVTALLLGVPVRKFSMSAKRQSTGVVRLGYVEVMRTDAFRTSLIGAAPLFAGITTLIFIGITVFNLSGMTQTLNDGALLSQLFSIFRAPDAWIWIYAVFAIANSMMPSQSDTQAWPPVIGFLVLFVAAALLLGGTALISFVSPLIHSTLRWLSSAFAVTAFVNCIVIAFLFVFARVLEKMTGRKVQFKR